MTDLTDNTATDTAVVGAVDTEGLRERAVASLITARERTSC